MLWSVIFCKAKNVKQKLSIILNQLAKLPIFIFHYSSVILIYIYIYILSGYFT